MEIPRFWAHAEADATGGGGRRYHLRVWGWSSQSIALAEERARSRLQQAIAKLASGKEPADHYPYQRAPVREEQIEELRGPVETPAAIVTRNRYGALVLNAARAMFIDVDAVPAKKKLGWFRRAPAGSDPEVEALRPVLERAAPRTFRV